MIPNKSVDIETDSQTVVSGVPCQTGWTACWKQRTLPEKLLLSAILVIFIGKNFKTIIIQFKKTLYQIQITGFLIALVVLVEIYLRLEGRLLTTGNKPMFVTDDVTPFISNLTKVFIL